MYRLLATDVDDTILAPDGSLPKINHDALLDLHHRGIVVVLSSGRPTISLRQMAYQIGDPDDTEYLISFNGARVTSAVSDTVVYERVLSREAVGRIMEYARAQDLFVQGYGAEDFLVEYDDPRAEAYAAAAKMTYRVVPNLVEALPTGSAKLLVIHPEEQIPPHQGALEELAREPAPGGAAGSAPGNAAAAGSKAGVLTEPAWVTTRSKKNYLEIVAPGVSKGTALRVLAEKLGIPIEETIAAGDSTNDREMLEAAGLGVAVANAREELKVVADLVLDRNAEEGSIAEIAERFFPGADG
jgi:hydroxymethylpyrimidine pyrophosphatase-like HAD family hydrolase